ncbi:hypothetical protein C900_05894 [Fulvivirga imtechensis AK7]|uniref:Yeast cell wall synthesis Kre9/Knh1-like N-terminal domain-containing protein n=1 Tax=Fulvivirga imtechensis AK7 TaxID=1237149 RepID=L8JIK5_9BACT|nr:hypothetical protein C900_05894 [Fulvivirga imtechensis AK7]
MGLEVKPGYSKKIIWQPSRDLGDKFNGKVALEVRSKLFIPFVNMEGFEETEVLKRTREYKIAWTGGHPQNVLNFDLYKGDEKILTYPNIANAGHYTLIVPAYVRPGKDYWFKVSDAKNKEEVVYTERFRIKRKIPLIAKIIPMAVMAGAGYYFLQPKGNVDNTIPDALLPDEK